MRLNKAGVVGFVAGVSVLVQIVNILSTKYSFLPGRKLKICNPYVFLNKGC